MRYLLPALIVCVAVSVVAESPLPGEPVIETVAEGFDFVEGPALAPDGSIWFTDIPANAIHRFDPATGETTQITNDSGGANGLMFLDHGDGFRPMLVVCEDRVRRRVAFKTPHPDMPNGLSTQIVVNGHFNGPNDLVALYVEGGPAIVFFTDPLYGNRPNPVGVEAVYEIDMSQPMALSHPGQIGAAPIITDLVRPNGIGLSPDQRTLYVADNAAKKIMAYPLDEDGKRDGEGLLFHDVSDLGGPDGMTVDAQGRVYQAIFGKGIVVVSPEGERLDFVATGPKTTNCVLAEDGRVLYVTAEGALKRIALSPD